MSRRDVDLDRRTFLALIGAGAGVSALGVGCVSLDVGARNSWVDASGRALWTPPAMPIPTWGDGGDAASDAARFASYEVQDALVVPEGFRYERVATWGEHFGDVRFGTSCDYTALVPIEGRPDEYFLVVNHEAVEARPWLQGYSSAHGAKLPELRIRPHPQRPDELCTIELDGNTLTVLDKGFGTWRGDVLSDRRLEPIARAALDDLGVSVLHVRQDREGCVRVLRASKRHARISGLHPTTPTLGNCSGGVTPWGTVLTAEENYQDYVPEAVDARGDLGIGRYSIGMSQEGGGTELPAYFRGLGAACDPPCDGRDFGWIGEVDPARGTLRKLHRLGRFRHENAAVCCRAGAALVVYQGDDRRGGHLWRYESAALVHDPRDAGNSALFDQGTLSVARFAADGTGIWVPLAPSTRLARPRPSACAGGTLWVPERRSVEVGQAPTGTRQRVVGELDASSGVPVGDWIASVEAACGKPFAELTLGDLVWPPADAPDLAGAALEAHRLRVIELDAFAMANAIGGTPLGRPEDVDLHPHDGSLYVALSDASGGGDGSPDLCVMPDALGETSRRYGVILRLVDDDAPEGRARTFRWSRFATSGELAEDGGGFGCPDNLAFDADGNLWMTTDLSTDWHNAAVRREGATQPGAGEFQGVFGSNALYYIPTRGPDAGRAMCFAIAPPESELTGPTFTPDGRALLLSVQHPGENHGARRADPEGTVEHRTRVAARDGTLFEQIRRVPLGSNWPSGERGVVPRSAVVCITRSS